MDKQTIPNTLTIVEVWNNKILYLAALIPFLLYQSLSYLCFAVPPICASKGVKHFAFYVDT